jgi:hypothetical protein
MIEFLFIYAKNGRIKCLNLKQSLEMEPFIGGQWKHTATIDPAKWIEALANDKDGIELIEELKGESYE